MSGLSVKSMRLPVLYFTSNYGSILDSVEVAKDVYMAQDGMPIAVYSAGFLFHWYEYISVPLRISNGYNNYNTIHGYPSTGGRL